MIADIFGIDINGALLAGLGACSPGPGSFLSGLHGVADRETSRT